MLKGIFINALNKAAFLEQLNAGNVKQTQIAFIKDTSEIWTQGKYYKVQGLDEELVIGLILRYGGGITLDELKALLEDINPEDFSTNVLNIFNKADSALQSSDIYNWALSDNNDKIPASKLEDFLVQGYLYNNRFFSTKTGDSDNPSYSDELSSVGGKFYYDKDTNKLYIYLNNVFTQISGNNGESDDLSSYLKSADAAETYITKVDARLLITDLVDGADGAYDTLKELADALLENKGNITEILSNLNNYYTKSETDSTFLTKTDAATIYATKTELADCKAEIINELNEIKQRLTVLENMWITVPTDEYNYYIGTDEGITALNYRNYLNLNELPATYDGANNFQHVTVIYPDSVTVKLLDPSGFGEIACDVIDTDDGYKIATTVSDISGEINISVS